jgi:hypothetical protein
MLEAETWASMLYIRNSTMDCGVKDWIEHPSMMTPNHIIGELWDSAPVGKVTSQDCQNYDQRHYGEIGPMTIFNSFETNHCCKLLHLSYSCMILLLCGRYIHQCRKSSNAAVSDRTDDHTGQVNKVSCICCYLIAMDTKHGMFTDVMYRADVIFIQQV